MRSRNCTRSNRRRRAVPLGELFGGANGPRRRAKGFGADFGRRARVVASAPSADVPSVRLAGKLHVHSIQKRLQSRKQEYFKNILVWLGCKQTAQSFVCPKRKI